MDIADLSISMSQASLAQKVDISVAKLAMESMNQDAGSITKIMELSVNPGLGSNFDASV
jgi:hypothetical protein